MPSAAGATQDVLATKFGHTYDGSERRLDGRAARARVAPRSGARHRPDPRHAAAHPPGEVRRGGRAAAERRVSTSSTNIDGVNAELQRLFPQEWLQIRRLRDQGVRSLDPAYQELVARVVPELEWVDPWGHPPLSREGGFEEAVYRSVVGPRPGVGGRGDAPRPRPAAAAA